jgi:PAS domain S-box-containing protein
MHRNGSPSDHVLPLVPLGHYALDSEWLFKELDSAAEEYFGRPARELIGRNIWSETARTPDSPVFVKFHEAIARQERVRFELESSARAHRWYEVHVHPRPNGGLDVYFHDITERKRAEEALARERDLLQSVLNGAGKTHLVYLDRDFNFVRVNEAYAATCGCRPEELIGKNHFALYPGAEVEAIFRHVRDTSQAVEIYDRPFEFPDQPWRGVTCWDWTLIPVKNADGLVTGLIFSLFETTGRKQAEEALRASEERLRLAQEAAHVGVWDRDMLTGRVQWSAELERMYGFGPGSFPGTYQAFTERVHPDDLPVIEHRSDAAVRAGRPFEFDFRVVLPTGDTRWMNCKGGATYDEKGNARREFGVNVDITERKHAEEALRLSEESFSKTFQAAGAAMALTRIEDGRILDVNDRWLELMECSRDEAIGKTAAEYGGWKDAAERDAIVDRLQTHGYVRDRECAVLSQRGREWTAVFSARTVTIRGEKVLISSAIDITERKKAEEKLRQLNIELERRVAERTAELHAASRYARSLIEASLDPLVTISAEGKITDVNDASASAVGVPREKLIGTDFSEYFTEPDKAREGYQRVFAEGLVRDYPLAIRHLSGRVSEVLYNATVYRNEAGEVQGVFAAARDVTDRKRAEAAVGAERQRFKDVLDQLPAYLVLLSADYRVAFSNRYFEEHFGQSHGERCYEYLFQRTEPCENCESFKVLKTGQPHNWEWMGPDGRSYDIHDFPFTDTDGSSLIMEVGVDVTLIKQAQTALRQLNVELEQRVAARTAALRGSEERLRELDRRKDEFIAVLSHELRNPLAPIQFALPALRSACSGQPTGVQAIGVIERQTAQLRRLIDDLLEVSRVTTGKLELRRDHLSLAMVVRIAMEAAAPSIAAGRHSLNVAVPEEPLWVFGDAARLSQVVMNLLDNAAKYTPRGGQLELTVARENNEGVLRVRDNGQGIPAEALNTIFEMFHQVGEHDSRGGLGIGLSLAQKLVEMHGGRIEARSGGAGHGAEFTVRLPLATPADERVPKSPTEVWVAGGRRLKVLIVDDNIDLVEMLAVFVDGFGHNVQKAFDGLSAVSAALVYRPDVVLLDLGLPGMTGLDVAQELRRHPETAATYLVALTGWGRADDMQRTQAAGFNTHLTKPTEPEAVRQLLEVIASGPPS